jgi:hypothetical protein
MPFDIGTFYKLVQDDWEQGDIVRDIEYGESSAELAVLITPQCDIVHDKADFLLFILSSEFKDSFQKIIDPNRKLSEDHLKGLIELSRNKLFDILNNIIHHLQGATSYRFYYLPEYRDINISIDHKYLDFQRILTVSREILDSWKEKRIANINDPFRSQIMSRYISYVGRIGTPDYEEAQVLNILSFSGLSFREEDFKDYYKKLSRNP